MMEEGLSTCEAKFQKLNNGVNVDGHMDMIGNLPDEIVQHMHFEFTSYKRCC